MSRYIHLSENDMEMLCKEIYELMTGTLRPNATWDYTIGLIDMISTLGITDEWNAYVKKVERSN